MTGFERAGTLARAAANAPDSEHLGATLRSVLVRPDDGIRRFVARVRTRRRHGAALAEGAATYVLSGIGGAALMSLWLRAGGALGLRSVSPGEFRWGYLGASLVAGAIVGVAATVVWGALRRLAGIEAVAPSDARALWGIAALPQLFFLVLAVGDIAVGGRSLYAGVRPEGAVAMVWGAVSIAAAAALAVWSAVLLVTGVRTTGHSPPLGRVLGAAAIAWLTVAVVLAAAVGVAAALA